MANYSDEQKQLKCSFCGKDTRTGADGLLPDLVFISAPNA